MPFIRESIVVTMNADGTEQTPIPGLTGFVFLDWSPDGSRVLLKGTGSGQAGDLDDELYSASPDGTDLVRITYDDIWLNHASWGP